MSSSVYISNSSPIIAFERLGKLDLLHKVVGKLLIPEAVNVEVFERRTIPSWIEIRTITHMLTTDVLAPRLGPGEREAIVLALEVKPSILLIDDLPARRAAEELDIRVIGVVGLLLLAKRRGLLEMVQPQLDALIAADFRIAGRLYANALRVAGEE